MTHDLTFLPHYLLKGHRPRQLQGPKTCVQQPR